MSRYEALRFDMTDEEASTGEGTDQSAKASEHSESVRQKLEETRLSEPDAPDTPTITTTTTQPARRRRGSRARVAGTDTVGAPPPADGPMAQPVSALAHKPASQADEKDEDTAIASLLARLRHGVVRVAPFEFQLADDWLPASGPRMRVPARFFARRELLELLVEESELAAGGFVSALQQLANVSTLPGILGASLAMPDVHSGYGFAIGAVAAFDLDAPDAVVSPGGVGFDINCGVRLLRSSLTEDDLTDEVLDRLADSLYKRVPVGTGADERALELDAEALDEVLNEGMAYLERRGLCWPEDRAMTEERGSFAGADASRVSDRAKARGRGQAGTLGAGNHYCEVQIVEEARVLCINASLLRLHTACAGVR